MPVNQLAYDLTDRHRAAQIALRARTLTVVAGLWPQLDVDDLDGSRDDWVDATVPAVTVAQEQSVQLAWRYLETFLTVSLGAVAVVAAASWAADPTRIAALLQLTGPITVKQRIAAGDSPEVAAQSAFTRTLRGTGSEVLNAGRSSLTEQMGADDRVVGWQRVTSATACEFCTMIASNGAVFRDDTVDFEAHANCACTVEPQVRDVPNDAVPREPPAAPDAAPTSGEVDAATADWQDVSAA